MHVWYVFKGFPSLCQKIAVAKIYVVLGTLCSQNAIFSWKTKNCYKVLLKLFEETNDLLKLYSMKNFKEVNKKLKKVHRLSLQTFFCWFECNVAWLL